MTETVVLLPAIGFLLLALSCLWLGFRARGIGEDYWRRMALRIGGQREEAMRRTHALQAELGRARDKLDRIAYLIGEDDE